MRLIRACALMFPLLLLSLQLLPHAHSAQEQPQGAACRKCNARFGDAGKRFSVVVPQGIEYSAFNDIGCAIIWKNGECAMRQDAFDNNAVVYDYQTGEELPIQKAVFVIDAGVKTPMGYGVIAFRSPAQAEKFVAEAKKGRVIRYQELSDRKW